MNPGPEVRFKQVGVALGHELAQAVHSTRPDRTGLIYRQCPDKNITSDRDRLPDVAVVFQNAIAIAKQHPALPVLNGTQT
jgi:hypothetical protein